MTQSLLLTGAAWTFLACIVIFVVLPTIRCAVREQLERRRLRIFQRELDAAAEDSRYKERHLASIIQMSEYRR